MAKVIKLTDNNNVTLLPISDSAYVQHRWKEGADGTTITSVQDALNYNIDRVDAIWGTGYVLTGSGTALASANNSSVAYINLSSNGGKVGIQGTSGSSAINGVGQAEVIIGYDTSAPKNIRIKVSYRDTNTDTKVTAVGNHYTPTGTAYNLTPSGTGSLTHNSSFVVTGLSYSVDAAGHITSLTATQGKLPADNDTKVTSAANHYTPTGTAYSLTPSGTGSLTHNSSFVVTGISYSVDTKGHITSITATQGKLPSDNDTKVTAVGNHYTPSGTAKNGTVDTKTTQLSWEDPVVVRTSYDADAAGHITKLTYTTYKLPANPLGSINPSNIVTTSSNLTTNAIVLGAANNKSVTTTTSYYPKKSTGTSGTNTGLDATSNTDIPTSQAVADYVSKQLGNLSGALIYKGTIDGNATTWPSSPQTGYVYVFAGDNSSLSGGPYEAGDIAIYNGSSWDVVTGENQWEITSSPTLAADGTRSGNLVTIEGSSLTLAHGSPTGSVKNATKGTDGAQLTANSSKVITGINWKADANGHVTEVSYTMATLPADNDTKVTSADNHYTPTGTSTNATYYNGTYTPSGATGAALTANSSLVITGIKYSKDSKGHVTDVSYTLGKLPADNDTKVTAVGNHYTPSGSAKTSTNVQTVVTAATTSTQLTANTGIVLTGVSYEADAAGHITKLSYSVAKLPNETDKKVEQKSCSTNNNFPVIFKASSNTTTETTYVNYDSDGATNFYYNPSTNLLHVAKINSDAVNAHTSYTFTSKLNYQQSSADVDDLNETWVNNILGTPTSVSGSSITIGTTSVIKNN